MGYQKLLRIGAGVVFFYLLLNVLVLRDLPNSLLKQGLPIVFLTIIIALFVLIFLNRYKP